MAKPDISRAQATREAKILDSRVNYEGLGTMTRRQFIDYAHRQGAKIVVHRVRQYDKEEKLDKKLEQMARHVAFGNPNLPETKEYYALRTQLKEGIFKEEIRLELPSGTSYELTKTELDYATRIYNG
jgi:hypothetical protein